MSQKVFLINHTMDGNASEKKEFISGVRPTKVREYPSMHEVMKILVNHENNSVAYIENLDDANLQAVRKARVHSLMRFYDIDKNPATNTNLVLINPWDEADDVQDYNDLRGTIIDMNSRQVVCKPFGFLRTCVQEELHVENSELVLQLESGPLNLPVEDIHVSLLHEGVPISIWKDLNGIVHLSSPKKINIEISQPHRNGSLPYDEIWRQLKGPDPKLFFNAGELSPFVYTFVMSYPDLLDYSKEISVGLLVYLGHEKMDITYPAGSRVATDPVKINLINSIEEYKKMPPTSELTLYSPKHVDLDEANHHLKYGRYKEWNMENVPKNTGTGECVRILHKTTNIVYNCMSPDYNWRANMRVHDNVLCNAFILFGYARNDQVFKNGTIPQFHKQNLSIIKDIISKGKPLIRYSESSELIPINNYHGRLLNIWLAYILAVPIHLQQAAYNTMEQYEKMVEKGADDLITIATDKSNSFTPNNLVQYIFQRASEIMDPKQKKMKVISQFRFYTY
jgi:hypothetical protein